LRELTKLARNPTFAKIRSELVVSVDGLGKVGRVRGADIADFVVKRHVSYTVVP